MSLSGYMFDFVVRTNGSGVWAVYRVGKESNTGHQIMEYTDKDTAQTLANILTEFSRYEPYYAYYNESE